jgi:ketosteroid isomerase-like protein
MVTMNTSWTFLPALLLCLTLSTPALPQTAAPRPVSSPEAAIQKVLDQQVAAWNRGDLPGYMAGYVRSPALTFYAGGTVTTGWQPTLDRYRRRYQGEGREMGQLDFQQVQIEVLCPDAALVRGRWHLTFAKADKDGKAQGLFTVFLRRFPEGWRILHDHSSSE